MANINYCQRVGFSRCIRCDFTTEGITDFAEQDETMRKHLEEKHPGWMTDLYGLKAATEGTPDHIGDANEKVPAIPQTDQALCDECSGNGKVLTECPSCTGSGYAPPTQPNNPSCHLASIPGHDCLTDPCEIEDSQPSQTQPPAVGEFPLRPQMEAALQGCGSLYLSSNVDDYIRRVEAEIASLRSQLIDVCPLKKHNEIVEQWANRYNTEHAARESVEASYRELQTALADAAPQPASQPQELKIPEDLRALHELAQQHRAWIRCAYDAVSEDGARISMWDLTTLIERVARAEGRQ